MQTNVITLQRATSEPTPLEMAEREIRFARSLAQLELLDHETLDAIAKALSAALGHLKELMPAQDGDPPMAA
jgi:hypothetical protein